MDIRQRSEIKQFAGQRLEGVREAGKILLIYAAATLGMALLVTVINFVLDLQIDKTGGLSNMGTRAVLDTLSQVLPLVQSILALCLELGYMAAMLRIARGQYVSHRTLKLGFDRFWPLLRLTILRGLIFLGVGFASIYLGTSIYLFTPLSDPVMELVQPLIEGASALDPNALLMDDKLYGQLMNAMIPCFLICGGLYALLGIPLWYRYRLAGYVLIDNPAMGASLALRRSHQLMRRNHWNLFRLDLSLWYYHLAMALAGFLAYGDVLLSLAGIQLPMAPEVSFFGFYLVYLVCQLAIYWFLRNRVEVSYCLAYDSLLPKEEAPNAVVLGNIFQM